MAKIDLTFAEMCIDMLPRFYISLNGRIINRRINRVTKSLKWMKDCMRREENAIGKICSYRIFAEFAGCLL